MGAEGVQHTSAFISFLRQRAAAKRPGGANAGRAWRQSGPAVDVDEMEKTTGGHPHRSIRSATASSHAWCENRRPTVFEMGDRIVLMGLTERPE